MVLPFTGIDNKKHIFHFTERKNEVTEIRGETYNLRYFLGTYVRRPPELEDPPAGRPQGSFAPARQNPWCRPCMGGVGGN